MLGKVKPFRVHCLADFSLLNSWPCGGTEKNTQWFSGVAPFTFSLVSWVRNSASHMSTGWTHLFQDRRFAQKHVETVELVAGSRRSCLGCCAFINQIRDAMLEIKRLKDGVEEVNDLYFYYSLAAQLFKLPPSLILRG